ncbi:hypothetical protein DT076_16505 [Desertihabitans brevis]|uniref:Glycosyltransferase family 2 protein n=1 Tax=Desertihabitans brevis TaxID=2268447 RepID=A0A367YR33_9ACTN|nr:glycosyltransferase [Desertihabitans brevis]RCK68250.1 hypothetical protein DT076_16505 [Desertihabitans brevis]
MELAPRTWFYTRVGIGIFDEAWWEFRTRLFAATILPSVARFCQQGARWVLVIDEDLSDSRVAALKAMVAEAGITSQVTLLPVQFHTDLFDALHVLLLEQADERRVGIVRVDDDDALAADFLSRASQHLREDASALVTMTSGWEVALAERKKRPMELRFGSLNTLYWGLPDTFRSYAAVGHHNLPIWAEKNGIPVVADSEGDRMFMYMRHKQSDSSFGGRRKAILEDPAVHDMTAEAIERFGLDPDRYTAWREFARTAPGTGSAKTWALAADIVAAARAEPEKRAEHKRRLIEATRNVLQQ